MGKYWDDISKETRTSWTPENYRHTAAHYYHTFRPDWNDPQIRSLASLLPWNLVVKAFVASMGAKAGNGVDRGKARSMEFHANLLMEYAKRELRSGDIYPEPPNGNPRTIRCDGFRSGPDVFIAALEKDFIGIYCRPKNVIEIGAGYGRTAYAFLRTGEIERYTIVDIEPALSISRHHLTSCFPEADLQFLHPEETGTLEGPFDLLINISSYQEMTAKERAFYLRLTQRLAPSFIYLKEWTYWKNDKDGCEFRFGDVAPDLPYMICQHRLVPWMPHGQDPRSPHLSRDTEECVWKRH